MDSQGLVLREDLAIENPPYTLHPTPCTLHPAPCAMHPTPYTPQHTLYTLDQNFRAKWAWAANSNVSGLRVQGSGFRVWGPRGQGQGVVGRGGGNT